VLHLPDVAIDAAGIAALGGDKIELGRATLDSHGSGGSPKRETAPGIKRAHGPGEAGAAGTNWARARFSARSRSAGRGEGTGSLPPNRAKASGVSMRKSASL